MTTSVERQPDWRFLRRPKWVLSHLLVLALALTMIGAGVWQVNRHFERGDRNDLIEARALLDPVPIGEVAPPSADAAVGESEQFRRVTLTGQYRQQDEVLIRNRTFEGAPGWWVLTPFVTEDGWAVAVNRGWIPSIYEAGEPRPGTEPPTGTITVQGTIQPARTAQGLQVADPTAGRLSSLARPDVERLAAQLDYDMSPVVVRIDPDTPTELEQPIPLALPALDAGPHISYAVQWFIFSTIAIVGYPLILRRTARARPTQDYPTPDQPKESEPEFQRG